ncbi:MAG: GxxExxY protein [Anaerolineales bacterium]
MEGKRYPEASLTHQIIGAAMEVHRILGPGFLESIYQAALEFELQARGLHADSQRTLNVKYKDRIIGRFKADLVVEEKVIVELKAASDISTSFEAQLLNYLRATGIRVGLLLNFGAKSLQIRRRII